MRTTWMLYAGIFLVVATPVSAQDISNCAAANALTNRENEVELAGETVAGVRYAH